MSAQSDEVVDIVMVWLQGAWWFLFFAGIATGDRLVWLSALAVVGAAVTLHVVIAPGWWKTRGDVFRIFPDA